MAATGSGDREYYDEDPPRSIFTTLWFRAVVVVLVLGVIAAVAVPYVLDVMNPAVPSTPITAKAPGPAPSPTAPPSSTSASTAPSSSVMPAPPPTAGPASTPPITVPSQAPPSHAKTAEAPKPTEAPKRAERPTPAPTTKAAPSSSQAAATSTQVTPKPAAKVATAPSPKATPAGPYWVQVGAFKDPAAAKRLAERLREQKYTVVEESPRAANTTPVATPSPAPVADAGTTGDRYDIFVSGPAPADISAKLGAKGLTADTVSGGVMVKPSLPLRDAVVLSRDLAADGLKVQVRRSGAATAPAAPAATSAPASSGDMFHRVRVGSFPDRPTAQTVLRELEGKGYKAFIARGSE